MDTATTTSTSDDAPASPAPGSDLRWWREILLIVAFYVVYSFVRNLFGSQGTGPGIDASVAFEHAKEIIAIERAMGLYFEPDLHQWYLDLPAMGFIRFWNVFYGTAHFVVTASALYWLFRKDKARYPRWRNTLGAMTAVALVGFASYSLMPPRLLDSTSVYGACRLHSPESLADAEPGEVHVPGCDEYGYVDTLAVHGGWISFDDEKAAELTNQYAAMPSMHIGWAVWSMLVLLPMLRRRWLRWLVIAYPVLTLFTIIVTANHYWLDAVGGLVALGIGAAVARPLTRWSRRAAT